MSGILDAPEKKPWFSRFGFWIAVFVLLALIFVILFPVFSQAGLSSGPSKESLRVRGVSHAVARYVADHHNRLPDFTSKTSLDALSPLVPPLPKGRAYEDNRPPSAYVWNLRLSGTDFYSIPNQATTWLFFGADSHGTYNVAFADGHYRRHDAASLGRILGAAP